MAQDEGRFGRINTTVKAWAPAHVRPSTPRQIVRQYLYVYSAVCPSLGKMSSLILPSANTEMMNIFLEHVATVFKDYFLIMIVDQAGWHLAKALKVPENIRLLPQPAHSPELNPTEHVWKEIKEKYFHNRIFKSLDHVEDTICVALKELASEPDRIRSLTNFPYMRITH